MDNPSVYVLEKGSLKSRGHSNKEGEEEAK